MIDQMDVRTKLAQRLAEVRGAGASAGEDLKPVELDQQAVGRLSRMDSLQVQAMAQAADGRRRLEIRKIEAALLRIKEDEYGLCTACGDPISEGRLGVDPTVATCIKCAPGK